jgi:hypothetical protein
MYGSDIPEAAYHGQKLIIRVDIIKGLQQRDIIGGHTCEPHAEIGLSGGRVLEEPQTFPRRPLLGETVSLYQCLGPHRATLSRLDVLYHNTCGELVESVSIHLKFLLSIHSPLSLRIW